MAQDRLHGGVLERESAISRRVNASCYGVKYLRRTHGRLGGNTLCETIIYHGYSTKCFHALTMQMVRTKRSLITDASSREYTKSDNYYCNSLLTINRSRLRNPIGNALWKKYSWFIIMPHIAINPVKFLTETDRDRDFFIIFSLSLEFKCRRN